MGRNCGDIALYAGVAGGAEYILVPEIPYDLDKNATYYMYSCIVKYDYSYEITGSTTLPYYNFSQSLTISNVTNNYIEIIPQKCVEDFIFTTSTDNDSLLYAAQNYLGCANYGNTTINVNYLKMKSWELTGLIIRQEA